VRVREMSHAQVERHQAGEGLSRPQMPLRELPELKLKLFRGVDALLNEQRVHRINGSPKAVVPRKAVHCFFKTD
jgi:hypothetical protein